ncbi:MAG: zinc-dependent metalloprotease [Actinomycetota bacterium]|nr:MAG: zinc-dependent metalloprotease [Actinomycetota bacterium]
MSDRPPFGFSGPDDPDDEGRPQGGGGPADPLGFLANLTGGGGGQFDMGQLGAALQQLGRMLQTGGEGPVNWEMAHDVARQELASQGDPVVGGADRRAAEEAVRLADLWLDQATSFPATGHDAAVWSRSQWLEATLPAWRRIVEPVAEHVQTAMGSVLPSAGEGLPPGVPPEFAAMAGPLLGMARQMGSAMFGMQLGQGLASLAGEVVGAADIGIPLTADGRPVLLPRNVEAFGAGLGIPADEVRLYLALRETAHQRLFTHVPWLRSRLEAAVEAYARGIHVDTARIEEAVRDLDPSNPAALQEVLGSGVFEPEDSPEQLAALARLETLLALVEGWVDQVVDAAVDGRLPSADRLRETVRRRRAAGGPAEKTFATLVGLELRPRRWREAATVWAELLQARGVAGRDAVWEHPDLVPTADDLDDPTGYLRRSAPLDLGELEGLPAVAEGEADAAEPRGDDAAEPGGGEDPGTDPGR